MKRRLGLDYDELFHTIPGNYIVLMADAPHYTILEASDTFCHLVGQARDEVLERPFRDVFPLSDDKESNEGTRTLLESFKTCLKEKVMHDAGIIRYDIKMPTGEFVRKLWVAKNYPIKKNGKAVGVLMAVEDVTTLFNPDAYAKERIAHLEHIIEINKSKDEFISIASHQLRTPATGVKQYLGMILEGFFGDITKEQREVIARAYDSNERQLRIVTDLLKVAQVDAGKVMLHFEVFDINDFTHKIIQDNKATIKRRKQMLTFVPAEKPLLVLADPETMRMVIENILDNASKYTAVSKGITVCVDEDDGRAVVSVMDEGVGIPEDKIDKLFGKFSRIDNELSTKVGGTGLGLYWAKKVIDLHDGDIRYGPNKPEGSIFSILLPKQKNV